MASLVMRVQAALRVIGVIGVIGVIEASLLLACSSEPEVAATASNSTPGERAWIDAESLAALLDQSIELRPSAVETTTVISLDGWVLRLAIDPLLAGRSPLTFAPGDAGGLRIAGIPEGSPWARVGLRDGDVLQSIDGLAPTDVHSLLGRYASGPRQVNVAFERDGQRRELELQIERGTLWGQSEAAMAERRAQHRRDHEARARELQAERNRRNPSLAELMDPLGGFARHIRCIDGRCQVSHTLLGKLSECLITCDAQAEIESVMGPEGVRGLQFTKIDADGVFAIAGIEVGDILVSAVGQPVSVWMNLDGTEAEKLMETELGKPLTFGFERDGQPRELEVELVESLEPVH